MLEFDLPPNELPSLHRSSLAEELLYCQPGQPISITCHVRHFGREQADAEQCSNVRSNA